MKWEKSTKWLEKKATVVLRYKYASWPLLHRFELEAEVRGVKQLNP